MARIFGVVAPSALALVGSMAPRVQQGYSGPAGRVLQFGADDASLAVFDRGAQRFAAESDGLIGLIDGAIYNRQDFAPHSNDAELVLQLYREYGFQGLLVRLNGDFAIAVFDRNTRSLWLGRDRLGVKPMYYASAPNLFAFCSRPRPLTDLPNVGHSINARFAAVFAASHYRYFDNVPGESPYLAVSQLPAAHWLCFRGGSCETGVYWRLEDRENFTESEDLLAEQYRGLLLSAVGLRYGASARPAFTLSGGMDSSSVLGLAHRLSGVRQEAFSTVYSDKTFDESDDIRPMLSHSVSNWHPVVVDQPDVFGLVARMIEVNDEPVATATWLSHFVLCEQAARAGFESLFGGLGGDELNAGEYEYFFFHFADLAHMREGDALDLEIAQWAAHHDHPLYRKSAEVAFATMAQCTDPQQPGRCLPDLRRLRRYYAALNPGFFDIEAFHPVMEAPFCSYLKTRSFQDLTRETAPCCLRAEDRQTQAFGLDNHVPFFDHRLVEFMFRVPGMLKIRAGITKILLRKAMRGIMPEETRTRVKKTGWNAPAHLWFSGEQRSQLLDLVHSRVFRERGIYDTREVLRIIDEHQQIVETRAAKENHMMFLWQLVNLELWLQSLSAG